MRPLRVSCGMRDLSEGFRKYRECLRLLWNFGFLENEEGESDFIRVEEVLFAAMVLTHVAREKPPQSLNGREYHDNIEVLPSRMGGSTCSGRTSNRRWYTGRSASGKLDRRLSVTLRYSTSERRAVNGVSSNTSKHS